MFKYFYHILFSFFLVLIQQSILTAFSGLKNFNLVLVFLVFIVIIFGFNWGFFYAIFFGIFSHFYSFMPFGSLIVIFLLALVFVDFLYKNVFINFSLYSSLILVFLATGVYSLLVAGFSYLFYFAGWAGTYVALNKFFMDDFFLQVIFNLFLMAIIYIIAKATIKSLNLAFLLKK